jgi:hypothetical protein
LGFAVAGLGVLGPDSTDREGQTLSVKIQGDTVWDLLERPFEELQRFDPVLLNLAVLDGIPEYHNLDIDQYLQKVDAIAESIGAGLAQAEMTVPRTDELYAHDKDIWRAGSMAIALAGPSVGISYTSAPLDPGNPDQSFIAGLLDTKRGTCASMPVLHLGIAHRLDWPMRAVVAADHMWSRWDDGRKKFNLEATDARSDGDVGSFATPSDRDYIAELNLPEVAVTTGSDMKSLSSRELLGVFLQMRAGYWAAKDRWDLAENDLLLARMCYPMNRDIFLFLQKAMVMRAGYILTEQECEQLAEFMAEGSLTARRWFNDHPEYPWDQALERNSLITDRME